MGLVRQMPELYLRGSLANVTMKSLTPEEEKHVSDVVQYVSGHPAMAKHRAGVIDELGNTIGADYSSDKRCGDIEFQVAVWKATVELLYHRKYTFHCENCGSSTWVTQQKVVRNIDRQKIDCPNCKKTRVIEAGDTDLIVGSYITIKEFQDSYKNFTPVQRAPKSESPIAYTKGDKKYSDPNKILSDDKQLSKFFGEFVWNYFRQQLAENSRKEHRKEPREISGRADEIIVEEILALCKKMKIDFHYCKEDSPKRGKYTIAVVGLLTPPEFTAELAVLVKKGKTSGVEIQCDRREIHVIENKMAGELKALVSRPEHVLVLDNNSTGTGDADGDFTISQISFRTIGAEKMNQDDHVAVIDTNDVIVAVRESLPEGVCQDIFDIQCGLGEIYNRFSDEHGDDRPKKNHIAKFLGITTRSVTIQMEVIRNVCLVHGLVPQSN